MKHIKLFESFNRDIIVTIPKSIKWDDYKKELKAVEDGSQIMNFKVAAFPKTSIGSKCYLLYDGYIRGWMNIVGMEEKSFTCSIKGIDWKGKFIERSGKFNEIEPIRMNGFQGFRYFNL